LSGGSKEEIVPGLRGLTLEYFDGLDWYDTWGDASIKKKVKYTTTEAPNLSGFPEAVRITLLLDPNPEKARRKRAAAGVSRPWSGWSWRTCRPRRRRRALRTMQRRRAETMARNPAKIQEEATE
jgi:hypothetical protein